MPVDADMRSNGKKKAVEFSVVEISQRELK